MSYFNQIKGAIDHIVIVLHREGFTKAEKNARFVETPHTLRVDTWFGNHMDDNLIVIYHIEIALYLLNCRFLRRNNQ